MEQMKQYIAYTQEVLPVSASSRAWLRRDRRVAPLLLPVPGALLTLALAGLPL